MNVRTERLCSNGIGLEVMGTGSDPQVFDRAFSDKITAKLQQHGLQQVKDDSNIPALFCGHEPGAA